MQTTIVQWAQDKRIGIFIFCLTTKAKPASEELCFNENENRKDLKRHMTLLNLNQSPFVVKTELCVPLECARNRNNAGYLSPKSINY